MFLEIEKAIDSQNYELAQNIIEKLNNQNVDKLWLRYYQALILEKQDKLTEAETNYRQIIKDSVYPDPKLISLVRNGIERIIKIKKTQLAIEKDERETKKKQFISNENNKELALLVLENVSLEQKKILAPALAKVMEIDRYTATLTIPTRSWRVYKTGTKDELDYYQSELDNIGLPCICYSINKVNETVVIQVKYVEYDRNNLVVYYQDNQEIEQVLKIDYNQINSCVSGMIPLFELTVNVGKQSKIIKKKSTLDYVGFYDLHLNNKQTIFRLNDRAYQFSQDKSLNQNTTTTKQKWQELQDILETKIKPEKVWSNFTLFGESVTQFPEMLKQVKSNVELFRREESLWDEAFQLYSSLILLQNN